MRLINAWTLELEEYFGDQIPQYAILSHTWRKGEVTFQSWQAKHSSRPTGYSRRYDKIRSACAIARGQEIKYLWVDTNCIDKESSAELSEAINSMFAWYRGSAVCFVHLDDFEYRDRRSLADLGACRWFSRGWTLQELLAPKTMQFFDKSWNQFGTKQSLLHHLTRVTSIQIQHLMYPDTIRLASISKRMSWAANRSTTREEDMAYCLLGLFEINMPLLYGEGAKAFIRLQEEIIQHSNDHTIFCWSWPSSMKPDEVPSWNGCLAPRLSTFRDSGDFFPALTTASMPTDFQLTNSGLRITLPVLDSFLDQGKTQVAMLNARDPAYPGTQLSFCLQTANTYSRGLLVRSRFPGRLLSLPTSWAKSGREVFLVHERDPSRKVSTVSPRNIWPIWQDTPQYALYVLYLPAEDSISPIDRDNWEPTDGKAGVVIDLQSSGEVGTWRARMKVKLDDKDHDFYVTVKIGQVPEDAWEATIKQRRREAGGLTIDKTGQAMSLGHGSEFKLEYRGKSAITRTMMISAGDNATVKRFYS